MREPAPLSSELNRVTREMDSKLEPRLIRIQTMLLAIGDELGVDETVLICWRGSFLLDEKIKSKSGTPAVRLFEVFHSMLPEFEKAQPAFKIAENWNAAWERQEDDIVRAVRLEIGDSVEESMWLAFERAASKIQPIRP